MSWLYRWLLFPNHCLKKKKDMVSKNWEMKRNKMHSVVCFVLGAVDPHTSVLGVCGP